MRIATWREVINPKFYFWEGLFLNSSWSSLQDHSQLI